MKNAIFMWHHFEQHEAAIFDKVLTKETKKRSFIELTKIVDLVNDHELLTKEDRLWMMDRIEDIVTQLPELISSEN